MFVLLRLFSPYTLRLFTVGTKGYEAFSVVSYYESAKALITKWSSHRYPGLHLPDTLYQSKRLLCLC